MREANPSMGCGQASAIVERKGADDVHTPPRSPLRNGHALKSSSPSTCHKERIAQNWT
jgi:hypothetical protein